MVTTFFLLMCVSFSGWNSGDSLIMERVDLIELNHFYDRQGKHVYDQVIFFERAPDSGRFVVRAWCLVEDRETLSRRPERDLVHGTVQVDWFDSEQKVLRHLTSNLFRESWTQIDPERANKRWLEERNRTSLIQSSYRFRTAEQQNQLAGDVVTEPSRDSNTNELPTSDAVVANRR